MKIYSRMLILSAAALMCGCEKSPAPFASGTMETAETLVSSEIPGKITELSVEEGDEIEAGKVVGKIDDTQFRLQMKNLQAQISALKSSSPEVAVQLSALEERLAKQRAEKARTERLLAAKSANKKTLDDIVSEIIYLERTIAAKKSTLDKSVLEIAGKIRALSAQIEICEDNIKKSEIINPVSGTVLVKYAEQNEVAAFSSPIYKIGDLKEMRLRAYFSAADISRLKIGQKLAVVADFGEDQTRRYDGVLIWVASQSEFTPKGIRTRSERADLVYAAKIAVKNDGYLKIGQYAEVECPDEK
ncbi:MAG: HlyD family efflux transporter periplasmic adaptor subunit [Opitutales bacterium]|nr:HlyD family efflux transporter periplasmic adaptor subunit [Opitutales bacterium]